MDALSSVALAALAYVGAWACEAMYHRACARSLVLSLLTRNSDFCIGARAASDACAALAAASLGAGVATPLRRWAVRRFPRTRAAAV
jgi:hypothetical protein